MTKIQIKKQEQEKLQPTNFEQEIINENKANLFPTHIVELPSRGLLYSGDNLLSKGTVEIKYMTAKEEDILTTESYIRQGVVIDKLLQSLIVGPKFDYDSLLIGDKDAIMIAARIYGYGDDYEIPITTPSGEKTKVPIKLSELEYKELTEELVQNRNNEFSFTTPVGKNNVRFKLLTVWDDKQIESNLKKAKTAGNRDPRLTVMLSQMILSVNGNDNPMFIKAFVEGMLVADSKALREYAAKLRPGVNMELDLVDEATGESFRGDVTFDVRFFWPDARI